MLDYFYTKEKDRLYVYDRESGYFQIFNSCTQQWETPFCSFSCVEHDNDDFAFISEEKAKEMSNGVSFEEDYKKYLSLIGML